MISAADMAACREAIRHGSRSFYAASKLLPGRVRDPALALYAFCRLADDAVDEQEAKTASVLSLRDRLERVYEGRPLNAPADRAFCAVVEDFDMPRALPEALLEGLAWDAMGRQYRTLPDLTAYSARVASAVGVMMCVLMRVRDPDLLARAADLGVAMQLTNIARDVGEDAREARLYLPLDWLDEAGIDAGAFLARPKPSPALKDTVARLLIEADRLYIRSEAGIGALPLTCRPGIYAARFIYAGIGQRIRRLDCDTITTRARTSGAQKIAWLGLALTRSMTAAMMPRSAVVHAQPLPEVAFLVDAAASQKGQGWSDRLIETFAQLTERQALRREEIGGTPVSVGE